MLQPSWITFIISFISHTGRTELSSEEKYTKIFWIKISNQIKLLELKEKFCKTKIIETKASDII